MPVLIPYHLTFRGGLHLGTRGVNLEEAAQAIPSDTLFSALLATIQQQGADLDAFVAPFLSEPPAPPFLLTSAFPRAGDLRFFPMPADLTLVFTPALIHDAGKKIRRIRYLSEGLLKLALSGQMLDGYLPPPDDLTEPTLGAALQGGALWFSLDEMDALPEDFQRAPGKRHALIRLDVWKQGSVPRVTINRVSSAATIFQAGRVSFARDCGLWFGVEWLDPQRPAGPGERSYQQAFGEALSLLQDAGLGGERTVGYGAFQAEARPAITLGSAAQPGSRLYLLSRYHPTIAELPAALDPQNKVSYTLTSVAGWLQSPAGPAQRRQRLNLVGEGSLVCPPAWPAGDVCDVQPNYRNPGGDLPHPVYRYGFALGVGWPASQK